MSKAKIDRLTHHLMVIYNKVSNDLKDQYQEIPSLYTDGNWHKTVCTQEDAIRVVKQIRNLEVVVNPFVTEGRTYHHKTLGERLIHVDYLDRAKHNREIDMKLKKVEAAYTRLKDEFIDNIVFSNTFDLHRYLTRFEDTMKEILEGKEAE